MGENLFGSFLKLFGSFWRAKEKKITKEYGRKWGSGAKKGIFLKMQRKFTEVPFICVIIKGKWRHGKKGNNMSLEQLDEITQEIIIRQGSQGNFWKTLVIVFRLVLSRAGMDPGNWSPALLEGLTNIYCSCRWFSCLLLIAVQLQQMAGKLGDCPSERFGPNNSDVFAQVAPPYSLDSTELASMATDLAGHWFGEHSICYSMALALFYFGQIILVLWTYALRLQEANISPPWLDHSGIFIYLVVLSKLDIGGIFTGFLPQKEIVGNGLPKEALDATLGIQQTVMPHNLYLPPFHRHARSIMILQMFVGLCVSCRPGDSNIELTLALLSIPLIPSSGPLFLDMQKKLSLLCMMPHKQCHCRSYPFCPPCLLLLC